MDEIRCQAARVDLNGDLRAGAKTEGPAGMRDKVLEILG